MRKLALFALSSAMLTVLTAARAGAADSLPVSRGGLVLFYRSSGAATVTGGRIIPESGRIEWNAKTRPQLVFTPVNEDNFDIHGGFILSFMALSGRDTPAEFRLTLTDRSGKTWRSGPLRLPIAGWRRLCVPIAKISGVDLRHLARIAVEAREDTPDPVYIIDDLRVSPGEVGFEMPDIPEVTAGIYFPEYIRESEVRRCLDDPRLTDRIAEIETLRRRYAERFRPASGPVAETASARNNWAEIQPDGRVTGLAPEIIADFERRTRSHRGPHEGFSRQTVPRFSTMQAQWRRGAIARTPENRAKFIRAFNRYAANEINRRGEAERWVTSSFLWPGCAANMYFTFFDDMEAVEHGRCNDPELIRLNRLCKTLACYAYQFPDTSIPGPHLTTEQFRHSGAWVGGNFGYRPLFATALICRNPLMLDVIVEVSRRALEPISYTTRKQSFWSEGITVDGAAWGHGEQNYSFGYPMSGVTAALRILLDCRDSSWNRQMAPEFFSSLINYVGGTQWFCYGLPDPGVTLMVPGRIGMIYNPDGFCRYGGIARIAEQLLELLPESAAAERAEVRKYLEVSAGRQPEVTGCRYFWNNDDLVFRRSDFYVGVNMYCRRTLSNESAPLASSKTDFLSDGATFIMKSPATYTVAKGFWKPAAVPGVTARQHEIIHDGNAWRTYRGLYNFAGGATDGRHGVCGFIYAKQPLKSAEDPRLYHLAVRKSYFCFEDEMVCLGADLTNRRPDLPGTIATTVDQTEWREPVEFGHPDAPPRRAAPGDKLTFTAEAPLLAAHGGVGYIVFSGGAVELTGENRTERWLEFDRNANLKREDRPRRADILMLQIDHGRQVKGGEYAYIVHLRTPGFAALADYYRNCPVRILANTHRLQAVRHDGLRLTQAVFFNSDTPLADGDRIWQFDRPAVAMFQDRPDGGVTVTVSDPIQNPRLKTMTLTKRSADGALRTFCIELPEPPWVGQSVSVELPPDSVSADEVR